MQVGTPKEELLDDVPIEKERPKIDKRERIKENDVQLDEVKDLEIVEGKKSQETETNKDQENEHILLKMKKEQKVFDRTKPRKRKLRKAEERHKPITNAEFINKRFERETTTKKFRKLKTQIKSEMRDPFVLFYKLKSLWKLKQLIM